jgi:UDP-N-acetylglucosamine 2-epimerase
MTILGIRPEIIRLSLIIKVLDQYCDHIVVHIRDVTERPETIECGSNILTGSSPDQILQLVQMVTAANSGWNPPREYLAEHVAMTVSRILMGFRLPDLAEQDWQDNSK